MRSFLHKVSSQEVSKRSVVELEYTIPSGTHLKISRFYGGHEYTTRDVRLELLLRDGGDTLLAIGYAQNFDIPDVGEETGDGTKKIILRLVNNDVGNLHMTGMWDGVLDS